MPIDDLIMQVGKLFGYARVTEEISRSIRKGIKSYQDKSRILVKNEKLFVNDEYREPVDYTQKAKGKVKKEEAHVVKTKEKGTQRVEFEKIIREAIEKRGCVTIAYRSRYSMFDKVRKIEPQSFDGNYIIAYCHLVKEDRTFRIDKVKNIS